MSYLNDEYNRLKKSFRDYYTIGYVSFYDLSFLVLSTFILIGWGKLVQSLSGLVDGADLANAMSKSAEELSMMVSQFRTFLFSFAALLLLLFIALFAVWCLTQLLGYARLARAKFTRRAYLKFMAANLGWLVIVIIPAFILMTLFRSGYLALLGLLVMAFALHLTNIFYLKLAKSLEFKKSLKKAFQLGAKKLHKFLLPYLVIIILYLAVSQLYWIYRYAPGQLVGAISIVISFVSLGWAKTYVASLVK